MNTSLDHVNELINKIVAERKQSRGAGAGAEASPGTDAKDLLDILLNASESDLSPQYLRDEILTFMGAGHETTATTTMWTLYELCRHPEIRVKVQQEIDGILGSPASADRVQVIVYDNINKFEYLAAVIKETLRLHPPVSMIGRKNLEDYQLGEYTIRKNSLIGINLLAVHTNPAHWTNPWDYKPERWLDGTKIHPFQYIPFSAGITSLILPWTHSLTHSLTHSHTHSLTHLIIFPRWKKLSGTTFREHGTNRHARDAAVTVRC